MRRRRQITGESGQAAAEFAIILPVLIILLCGIIEFGTMYLREYRLQFAAAQAAEWGADYLGECVKNGEDISETGLSAVITGAVSGSMGTEEENILTYSNAADDPGFGAYELRVCYTHDTNSITVRVIQDTKVLTAVGSMFLNNVEGNAIGCALSSAMTAMY